MSRSFDETPVCVPQAKLINQTSAAGLFVIEGKEHWIPWSIYADESEPSWSGESGQVIIPLWFAEQEGIPYED